MRLRNNKIIGDNLTPEVFFSRNDRVKSVDIFKEFASESTVHGFPFIARSKKIFLKLFWLTVVLISFSGAVMLAMEFHYQHDSANMQTTVDDSFSDLKRVELPAITICHPSLIAKHRVDEFLDKHKNMYFPSGLTVDDFKTGLPYLRQLLQPSENIEVELENVERIVEHNNISIKKLFDDLSPSCDDVMLLCIFGEKEESCENLFKRSFTREGPCCSFNYFEVLGTKLNRTSEDNKLSIATHGLLLFLSVLIKPYPSDDRLASLTLGENIKVIIHESFSYPGLNHQEVPVTISSEYFGTVYGTKTEAGAEVKSLPINKRKCYLSSPNDFYRAANSYVQCQDNEYIHYCGCVPFYAMNLNYPVCNVSHISCLHKYEKNVTNINFLDEKCHSQPDCEGTIFKISGSSLPLDAPQFNPTLIYQTAIKHPGSTIIQIAYATESFKVQKRELVLSWINLVSSLGGVFSLCLGCSFISLLEIINFIIKIIWKVFCYRKDL